MTEQQLEPQMLGEYRLLDRIGEGGMGVVYRACGPDGQTVAVKELRPTVAAEPLARQRLAREVETMQRVHSPHVAEVIGADIAGDRPYIVTRYVPGRTLDAIVSDGGSLTGAVLARLASGLAEALAAVHGAGVVHRDLKPGNVMLVDGSPVVIDFGIAQGMDATRLTVTGMFMGTPGYLAPEVIEGAPSTVASDVHAWGATLVFAATGRPPYGTGPFERVFYRILNGKADFSGIPVPLVPLLTAALDRDPAHRPSAAALAAKALALDPAALVPGPVSGGATADGAQPGAVRADGAFSGAAAANGAEPGDGVLAAPPAGATARDLVAVPPAGTLTLASRGQTANLGMLPPVSYPAAPPQPYGPPGGQAPPPAAPRSPQPGSLSRWQSTLVAACGVAAAATSVILPVAGTVVSLALIAELRALGLTQRRTLRRRAARGAKASDGVVAVVAFPLYLVQALLTLLLLSPLALATAAIAAGITVSLAPGNWPWRALAYAAGAAVLFYAIGPGSSTQRRQLGRAFGAVPGGAGPRVLILMSVGAVAVASVTAALSWPSFYWPLHATGGFLNLWVLHLGPLRHLATLRHFGLARRISALGRAVLGRLGTIT